MIPPLSEHEWVQDLQIELGANSFIMKSSSSCTWEKLLPLHYNDFDYHRLVGVKDTEVHLRQLPENLGFFHMLA